MPRRTHRHWRSVLALATLLAMIAAPLCGPLCAAGACAHKAESQAASCHEETASSRAGDQQAGVTALKNCNLSEIPAAKLNDDSKIGQAVSASLLAADGIRSLAELAQYEDRLSQNAFLRVAPNLADTISSTVLRI